MPGESPEELVIFDLPCRCQPLTPDIFQTEWCKRIKEASPNVIEHFHR